MTPDLAGFIAEGDDPQTWDEITPAVLAALTAEFEVLPERAGAGTGTGALGQECESAVRAAMHSRRNLITFAGSSTLGDEAFQVTVPRSSSPRRC